MPKALYPLQSYPSASWPCSAQGETLSVLQKRHASLSKDFCVPFSPPRGALPLPAESYLLLVSSLRFCGLHKASSDSLSLRWSIPKMWFWDFLHLTTHADMQDHCLFVLLSASPAWPWTPGRHIPRVECTAHAWEAVEEWMYEGIKAGLLCLWQQ